MKPWMIYLAWGLILTVGVEWAKAADPWSTADKTLAVTAAVAMAADWRQTQQIVEQPNRYHELNPILGAHPTMGAVNRHFALNAALIASGAHYLPSPWRKAYL